MKTPEEWIRDKWDGTGFHSALEWMTFKKFIEDVQKDALNNSGFSLSDQKEIELTRSIADNERIRADQLHGELIKTIAKWHQCRRYLRQANKGAERNNMVMRLQAQTIQTYIEREKNK